VVEIQNYLFATLQLAQTTLRSVGGQTELGWCLSSGGKWLALMSSEFSINR
jgi:hypothetical protein